MTYPSSSAVVSGSLPFVEAKGVKPVSQSTHRDRNARKKSLSLCYGRFRGSTPSVLRTLSFCHPVVSHLWLIPIGLAGRIASRCRKWRMFCRKACQEGCYRGYQEEKTAMGRSEDTSASDRLPGTGDRRPSKLSKLSSSKAPSLNPPSCPTRKKCLANNIAI